MADEDQAEGELPQPGLGDGELEEDGVITRSGVEGVVESLLRLVGLLVDELATDVVAGGEVADGLGPGEGSDSELLSLGRGKVFGGAGGGSGRGGGRVDAGYNTHAWDSVDRVDGKMRPM
jgi:hypothetical protein